MNYFIYVPGLVGLETETDDFSWSFGCRSQTSGENDYRACKVRMHLRLLPDKQIVLPGADTGIHQFRRFSGRPGRMELFFSHRVMKLLALRFCLTIQGDDVYVTVGKNYLKRLKYKIMNLHPIWYIMFDVAAVLLLKKGYLTLYAAAVQKADRAELIMGAPGSGKTYTALSLAMRHGYRLLSEDISVTDGERIWPVPWTQTYRSYGRAYDEYIRTAEKQLADAPIDRVFILENGGEGNEALGEPAEQMLLLNRYSIGFDHSPALIALNYFNKAFSLKQAETAAETILRNLAENKSPAIVCSQRPEDFCEIINDWSHLSEKMP